MIVPPTGIRVLVATKPVDFRKGMDGLAALVQEELKADPFSGVIYVFRAKRADRVKLLFWDQTGLCLLAKRLEGGQFRWPAIQDGVMRLSPAQLVRASRRAGLGACACAPCRPAHSDAVIHIVGVARAGASRCKSAIHAGMTLSLDELPNDVASLKALLLAAHADNAQLAARNERLDHIIKVLRRARFGRSSERIDEDQLDLALEDVETGFAAEDAKAEQASDIKRREALTGDAPIAATFRRICRARRSSSSRRPRPAHAAVAPCTSSARMSPSASTRCRPSCA